MVGESENDRNKARYGWERLGDWIRTDYFDANGGTLKLGFDFPNWRRTKLNLGNYLCPTSPFIPFLSPNLFPFSPLINH
jgi:hypothetical protein